MHGLYTVLLKEMVIMKSVWITTVKKAVVAYLQMRTRDSPEQTKSSWKSQGYAYNVLFYVHGMVAYLSIVYQLTPNLPDSLEYGDVFLNSAS
jgi:hypothetical protein